MTENTERLFTDIEKEIVKLEEKKAEHIAERIRLKNAINVLNDKLSKLFDEQVDAPLGEFTTKNNPRNKLAKYIYVILSDHILYLENMINQSNRKLDNMVDRHENGTPIPWHIHDLLIKYRDKSKKQIETLREKGKLLPLPANHGGGL